jgi:predicted Zn-dependent protease
MYSCLWRERLKINHEGPVVWILSTFSYTGAREAIGGYASVCDLEGVGGVFFGAGKKFEGRLATLLAHEIGHIFGANHDPSLPVTLMNPAAVAYWPDKYSDKSIKEMRKCQR